MNWDIIKKMSIMISFNLLDKFIKEHSHGVFSCEIFAYDDVAVTEFEINLDTGDVITWSMDDGDILTLNGTEYTDTKSGDYVIMALWEYMRGIVHECVDKDVKESTGFFFINSDKF